MNAQIHKNMAACRICNTVINSINESEWVTCTCGCIAISGGIKCLRRNTRTWADLKEMSEYLLTWRDVLDCKQVIKLNDAAANAKMTGHQFFVFDGDIYQNIKNGKTVKTDKTAEDMNKSILPCTIGVAL